MRARGRMVRLGLGAATAAALAAAAPAAASVGPVVAAGPDGTAHFAWTEYAEETPGFIQARHMSATGALGPRDPVALPAGDNDAGAESIGVGADGNAVIGWLETDGGSRFVKARRRSPSGAVSATQTLSPAGKWSFGMKMDVEPDRDAIFVWNRSVGDTGNYIIQARRRLASGLLSETYTLSYLGAYSTDADVAVTPDGRVIAVWLRRGPAPDRNYYVQARTIAADGTLGETQNLTTASSSASSPRVVVSDAGVATIAWGTDHDNNGVTDHFYRVRAADGTLSSTVPLASNVAFSALSMDGNGAGRTVFTWLENLGGVYDTKARVRAAGGPLYATFDVGGAGAQSYQPVVEMDPEGNTTFAWKEVVNGNSTVHVRRRSVAGSMGPLRLPAQPAGVSGPPFLAVDAGGKATVAWFTDSETVWARTITPGGTMSPAIKRIDD